MKKGSNIANGKKRLLDFVENKLSNENFIVLENIIKENPMYLIDSIKVGEEAKEDFDYMKTKFKDTHLLGIYLLVLIKNFIKENDIQESSKKNYLKMLLDEIIQGI